MSIPPNSLPQPLLQQLAAPPPLTAQAPRARKVLRPSARELEKTTLKETPNGQLARESKPLGPSLHVRSNTLQELLQNRASKEALERANIVPQGQISSTVQQQAQKLEQQKKRDSLQGLLNQRPTIEALAERNVYKPVVLEGSEDLHIPLALEFHHSEVSQESIAVPHRIDGLRDIVQVACGWSHSLALDRSGSVWSWGSNLNGRLGRLVKRDPSVIASVESAPTIKLDEDSPLKKLGQLSKKTQFGGDEVAVTSNSPPEQDSVPARIPGLRNCFKIVCGDHHSAALCADGVYVWGRNEFGMLGLGHRDDVPSPTRVDLSPIIHSLGLPDSSVVSDIALGPNHTALIIAGKALAAGWNKGNRLGLVSHRHFISYHYHNHEDAHDTTVISRFQPIKGLSAPMRAVSSLAIRTVAAGDVMTIAVADVTSNLQPNHNHIFLWGTSMHSSPYPIIELNGIEVRMVRMGSNFCVLLTGLGEIFCFGSNRDSQLGRPASNDLTSFHAPGPVVIDPKHYNHTTGYPRFKFVACGKYHSLAIDTFGRLFSWGLNKHGILGHPVNDETMVLPTGPTPVDVTSILDEKSKPLFHTPQDAKNIDFKFIHCDGGASHTLLVDNNGFVYAMGSFRSGKLGL